MLFGALVAFLFTNTQVGESTEMVAVKSEAPNENTPIENLV